MGRVRCLYPVLALRDILVLFHGEISTHTQGGYRGKYRLKQSNLSILNHAVSGKDAQLTLEVELRAFCAGLLDFAHFLLVF